MNLTQIYAAGRLNTTASRRERNEIELAYYDAKGLDGDGRTLSIRDLELFERAHPERRAVARRLRAILQLPAPPPGPTPSPRNSSLIAANEAVRYVATMANQLETNGIQGPIATQPGRGRWTAPRCISDAVHFMREVPNLWRHRRHAGRVPLSGSNARGALGSSRQVGFNFTWVGRSRLAAQEIDNLSQTVWRLYRLLPDAWARRDFTSRIRSMMRTRTGTSADGTFNAAVSRFRNLLRTMERIDDREQSGQPVPELASRSIPS